MSVSVHDTVTPVKVGLLDYSRPGYRAYVLAVLTAVYIFSYIDRKVLFILQEPIKLEFGLSDSQLGLLTGFTFTLFYAFFGIPIARMADKGVRRTVVALAVSTWSLMTAICGLAQSYLFLLTARIGVAIGEAGGSPPSHSMISDIFPAAQRGRAMSIYTTGVYLGVLVGFLIGGWITQYFGWRTAFLVVGLPGLLMGLLVWLTVKEPERKLSSTEKADDEAPPLSEVLRSLWALRSFRYMVLGASMSAFFANSMIGWMPSFLMRSHSMPIAEVGTWLALILGLAGVVGALLGGYLGDRLGDRDKRWYPLVPALAMLIALPFTALTFWVDGKYLALIMYVIPVLVSGIYSGPVLAMIHTLAHPRSRAMASAIFFLVQNMIGAGLGPLVVGVASDLLAPQFAGEALRYALLVSLPISAVLSVGLYFMASRKLQADLDSTSHLATA
jgi:predicted MFS family arabinose efflux permease